MLSHAEARSHNGTPDATQDSSGGMAALDEDEMRELTLSISRLPKSELQALYSTITKLVCAHLPLSLSLMLPVLFLILAADCLLCASQSV